MSPTFSVDDNIEETEDAESQDEDDGFDVTLDAEAMGGGGGSGCTLPEEER